MIRHATLDKLGAWASLTCAAHCLVCPILLVLLPISSIWWIADANFERWFIGISAVLAISSITYGFLKHRNPYIFLLLTCGLLTIVVAHHYHSHDSHFSSVFMGIGGMQVFFSHYLNFKLCQTCTKCNH